MTAPVLLSNLLIQGLGRNFLGEQATASVTDSFVLSLFSLAGLSLTRTAGKNPPHPPDSVPFLSGQTYPSGFAAASCLRHALDIRPTALSTEEATSPSECLTPTKARCTQSDQCGGNCTKSLPFRQVKALR